MVLSRRSFIGLCGATAIASSFRLEDRFLMTVGGQISSSQIGKALIHEHFLVDFIGADKIHPGRWNRVDVVKKVLPYLVEVKTHGVKTVFDCTPAYLGRDVLLLKELADRSGLNIVTNTGYYGAVDNKYLPQHAFTETAAQLAARWINEYEKGIEGTGVRPGFMKISVNPGPLSELHRKLVEAAAITHKATGLTICSHTGPALPAMQEIELLKQNNVDPSAFVWVHAQAEKDKSMHQKAAAAGTYVSLDGIGWGDFDEYADSIARLKAAGLLHRVLISHDAGWYKPEDPGATFKGFTNIFTELIPVLRSKGFTEDDFNALLVKNPVEAFTAGKRLMKQ
jgi:phosphotriesterase-related protein